MKLKKPNILETKHKIYNLILKYPQLFKKRIINNHPAGFYYHIEFFIGSIRYELYIQYYVRRRYVIDWIMIGKEHFYNQISTKEVKMLAESMLDLVS